MWAEYAFCRGTGRKQNYHGPSPWSCQTSKPELGRHVIDAPQAKKGLEITKVLKLLNLNNFPQFILIWQDEHFAEPLFSAHQPPLPSAGLGWKLASASGSHTFCENAGFQASFGFQTSKSCWLQPWFGFLKLIFDGFGFGFLIIFTAGFGFLEF